jgi:hypothetical protein
MTPSVPVPQEMIGGTVEVEIYISGHDRTQPGYRKVSQRHAKMETGTQ